MRFLQIVLLLPLLFSCGKEECKECETVVYTDRRAQQGLANNGFEEESRDYLGTFCGDALKQTEGTLRINQVVFGSLEYTERIIVECN